MKKYLLFCVFSVFTFLSLNAQYAINPYIQTNYEYDAYVLALREILSNPSDPDYDNPTIPTSRLTPYLEDLSAIYDNAGTNSEIDFIFNSLDIHANQEYESTFNGGNYRIDFKKMIIAADASDSWISGFINTGVSGITALDDLLTLYQFSLISSDNYGSNTYYFTIETSNNFMNLNALADDFSAIPEINGVDSNFPDASIYRFNYTGIPHTLVGGFPIGSETGQALVSNIIVEEDSYKFLVYGGDCFAGCTLSETRTVSVDTNYNVLSNQEFTVESVSIYPNPVSSILNISSPNTQAPIDVSLYDLLGKQLLKQTSGGSVDVSNLKPGIYLIKLSQDQKTMVKKIVVE